MTSAPIRCHACGVFSSEDVQRLAAAKDAIRAQVAFYGSTPAYRPVLELHGSSRRR